MAPRSSSRITSIKRNAPRSSVGATSQPVGAYAPTGYLPLPNDDLQRILSCSTSLEKEEKALSKFQKMRSETSIWRNKQYDPQQDRWFQRLKRYLKFFHNRKTASGWPITPFKFIIWATHDARPTIRSIRTYLETIEFARVVTHALFHKEFPDLDHYTELPKHPDVSKFMKEQEIILAHTAVPNTSTSKKITKNLHNSSSHLTTPAAGSSTTSTQKLETNPTQKTDRTEPKKKRKIIIDSDSNSESMHPLWELTPPRARTEKKPRKKITKFDSHQKQISVNNNANLNQSFHPTVPGSSDLKDPFLGRISRFSDLKLERVQDAYLNSFRLYHPSKKSVDQEIEELSEEIEHLTSKRGELSQIASKEVLKICLKSYLEFWENKQISGFPIQAIKLCVWFDWIQVNRKEAIDIALGFERLGKRVEDRIDDHQPILFEPLAPLTQSTLWISFLDHFGWRANQVEPQNPKHDQDDPQAEQGHPMKEERQLESPCPDLLPPAASISNYEHPSHDHLQPHPSRGHRETSMSSIGSSLTSLPNSFSPLSQRLNNSLESECIPEANSKSFKLDHPQISFRPNDHDTNKNYENHEEQVGPEGEGYNCDDGYRSQFIHLSYKKAQIHSSQHQQFLRKLQEFIQLL